MRFTIFDSGSQLGTLAPHCADIRRRQQDVIDYEPSARKRGQLLAEIMKEAREAGCTRGGSLAGLEGLSGARIEKMKAAAKRAVKASWSAGKQLGHDLIVRQGKMIAIMLRHPEILTGAVSPSLIKEVTDEAIASGGIGGQPSPKDAYKFVKQFIHEYRQSAAATV